MSVRYLTKSRFKVGYECPTKLQYLDDRKYGNNNVDNSFLEALSEGGFQVGELAKVYHASGTEITEIDKAKAVQQTEKLLEQENVTIYEAAISVGALYVRVDVLVKRGNSVELIEVKAKSFDPEEENPFYTKTSLKRGVPQINSAWEPYLVDIAFQTHVFKTRFPELRVSSSLMLANKRATATVDGLNQRFFIEKCASGRARVKVAANTTIATVGAPLLVKVPVDDEVEIVFGMKFDDGRNLQQMVALLSAICNQGKKHDPKIGAQCKSCEFKIPADAKKQGLKSGFDECWAQTAARYGFDLNLPLVFDIWNFRKPQSLIDSGVFLMRDVQEDDISPSKKNGEIGLSSSERQWLQVEKTKHEDPTPYFDLAGLARELGSCTYPLHFIDFETTMAAIPFHKGRRPYEQIAFQFSHHTVDKDMRIVHKTEYINHERGKFPNFEFVRALKEALSSDNGTIFRYAAHENTVLCQIKEQLVVSGEADRDDLITFIETITNRPDEGAKPWSGERAMVDMCEMVKRFFYHPATKGSNSIKKVLPAVLNESEFLRKKYSSPIYGSPNGIESKNFSNWAWIQVDDGGAVVDPYKRLPPIFSDLDLETMDSLITDGSIADGGAAMTAYARMQFTEMSAQEAEAVAKALLKYCELDTFAMVLIWEYWKHEIDKRVRKAA